MINLLSNKYKEYNILIVGVGGTGSHLISFLSQLIGNRKDKALFDITLIDKDHVEEKNLTTQKFLYEDITKNKAEVLSERYNAVYDLNIKYIDKFIENKDDLISLLCEDKQNIIISCVDNNKARAIIDTVFNQSKVYKLIYIDTGNNSGSDIINGQTIVGFKEYNKILLPSVGKYYPQIYEEEKEDNTLSCSEAAALNIQNIGANITSAATVFNILNNIISFKRIPADFVLFDASNITTQNMKMYDKKLEHLSYKYSMNMIADEYYKFLNKLFGNDDNNNDKIIEEYMNEYYEDLINIANQTAENNEPKELGSYGVVYTNLHNKDSIKILKSISKPKNIEFNKFNIVIWENYNINIITYMDEIQTYPESPYYDNAFTISDKLTIRNLFKIFELNKLE